MENNNKVSIEIKYEDYQGDSTDFKKTFSNDIISSYDLSGFGSEVDFLVDMFKSFLVAHGFSPITVSKIQALEDDEWRYVLTRYGEWNDYYEKLYQDAKTD